MQTLKCHDMWDVYTESNEDENCPGQFRCMDVNNVDSLNNKLKEPFYEQIKRVKKTFITEKLKLMCLK